jgi:hypothetical protein
MERKAKKSKKKKMSAVGFELNVWSGKPLK